MYRRMSPKQLEKEIEELKKWKTAKEAEKAEKDKEVEFYTKMMEDHTLDRP